ncbi:unnamed protein product [Closterium sp. Naga37s-1]|nr:unnamed protein product [Closterium sp. Naga37s-1]
MGDRTAEIGTVPAGVTGSAYRREGLLGGGEGGRGDGQGEEAGAGKDGAGNDAGSLRKVGPRGGLPRGAGARGEPGAGNEEGLSGGLGGSEGEAGGEEWRRRKVGWLAREVAAVVPSALVRLLNTQKQWMRMGDLIAVVESLIARKEVVRGIRVFQWALHTPFFSPSASPPILSALLLSAAAQGKIRHMLPLLSSALPQGVSPSRPAFEGVIRSLLLAAKRAEEWKWVGGKGGGGSRGRRGGKSGGKRGGGRAGGRGRGGESGVVEEEGEGNGARGMGRRMREEMVRLEESAWEVYGMMHGLGGSSQSVPPLPSAEGQIPQAAFNPLAESAPSSPSYPSSPSSSSSLSSPSSPPSSKLLYELYDAFSRPSARGRHVSKLEQLLKDLSSLGAPTTPLMHSRLAQQLACLGDIDKVDALLAKMRLAKLPIPAPALEAAVIACARAYHSQGPLGQQGNFGPGSREVFGVLTGLPERAARGVREVEEAGFRPSQEVLVALMEVLSKAQRYREAVSVWPKVVESAEAAASSSAVASGSAAGGAEAAGSGGRSGAGPAWQARPSLRAYNVYVEALSGAGEVEAAEGVVREMGEKGMRPLTKGFNAVLRMHRTYDLLLLALSEAGDVAGVERVYEHMLREGVRGGVHRTGGEGEEEGEESEWEGESGGESENEEEEEAGGMVAGAVSRRGGRGRESVGAAEGIDGKRGGGAVVRGRRFNLQGRVREAVEGLLGVERVRRDEAWAAVVADRGGSTAEGTPFFGGGEGGMGGTGRGWGTGLPGEGDVAMGLRLTREQRQVLVGALLAGAEVESTDGGVSYSISFSQPIGAGGEDWRMRVLDWLYEVFLPWVAAPPVDVTVRGGGVPEGEGVGVGKEEGNVGKEVEDGGDTIRVRTFATIAHPSLQFYARQFRPVVRDAAGKRGGSEAAVPRLIHRWLSPRGMTTWLMYNGWAIRGDGGKGRREVEGEGEEEAVGARAEEAKQSADNKGGGGYSLVFGAEGYSAKEAALVVAAVGARVEDCAWKKGAGGKNNAMRFSGSSVQVLWQAMEPYVVEEARDVLGPL